MRIGRNTVQKLLKFIFDRYSNKVHALDNLTYRGNTIHSPPL